MFIDHGVPFSVDLEKLAPYALFQFNRNETWDPWTVASVERWNVNVSCIRNTRLSPRMLSSLDFGRLQLVWPWLDSLRGFRHLVRHLQLVWPWNRFTPWLDSLRGSIPYYRPHLACATRLPFASLCRRHHARLSL